MCYIFIMPIINVLHQFFDYYIRSFPLGLFLPRPRAGQDFRCAQIHRRGGLRLSPQIYPPQFSAAPPPQFYKMTIEPQQ